eukprot:s1676_g7.t2
MNASNSDAGDITAGLAQAVPALPRLGNGPFVFKLLAGRCHDFDLLGRSLAWVLFNFPRAEQERSIAAAVRYAVMGRLNEAHAMHRDTPLRRRPCFPLPLGTVSSVKTFAEQLSLDDFCRLPSASLTAADVWTALGIIGLNGMAGFCRAPNSRKPTEVQSHAIASVRQSTNRVLALDVTLDRSVLQAEKELASRFLSYSGEEVPKMQPLSFEAASAALPPESHGGSIDALGLVSSGTKRFLEHPEESLLTEPTPGCKLQAKVHIAPKDSLRWFQLLVQRRICRWVLDDEVMVVQGQKILNGMFAVGKGSHLDSGEEIQRTIMNLIPTNACFRQIEGATAGLPSICQYLSLVLGSDERVWFYQSDMSSAFYLFRIPSCWSRMMAFNISFLGETLGLQRGSVFRPACAVIPMGWHTAVSIMQEIADRLTTIGRLPVAHKVRRGAPLPTWLTEVLDESAANGQPWYHVYLDNFCAMEKGTAEEPPPAGHLLHEQLERAWSRAGVLSSAKKRVVGAPLADELGARIAGAQGFIGAGPERLLKLIQSTLVVIGKPQLKRKWVQVIAGRWVHCMSFRRPSMTMLDTTWQFISGQVSGPTVETKTRSELFGCCLVALLIHTNLRAGISSTTTASDASATGGAIGRSDSLSLSGIEFAQADRSGRAGGTLAPILVLSLFNGVGCTFRCYDLCGIVPEVAIAYELSTPANRVMSRRWPHVQICKDVCTISLDTIKDWRYRYPQIQEIHVWGGFPCIDLSSVKSGRENLAGAASGLFYEIPRIIKDCRKVFGFQFPIRYCIENVASMDESAEAEITRVLGVKPLRLDPCGVVPIHRPRFCWSNTDFAAMDGVEIEEKARWFEADRRRARLNIVLQDVGITSSTLERYHFAVSRLAPVLEQVCTETQLDDMIADWIQAEFEDGCPLHLFGDALSGLHYFEPFTKRKLTKSWRLYSIWRRYEVPCRAPPVTQGIVLGMAGYCISICELSMAALLLLGFHCLMRTGELLQVRPCDFILDNTVGLVSIPTSKSGIRHNTRESVTIRDAYTLETVAAMIDLRRSQGLENVACWDRSGSAFRDLFRRVLDHLELTSLGFRPYSLRRGGATWEMQSHGLMERTLIRGRWKNSNVARIYIADGLAMIPRLKMTWSAKYKIAQFSSIFVNEHQCYNPGGACDLEVPPSHEQRVLSRRGRRGVARRRVLQLRPKLRAGLQDVCLRHGSKLFSRSTTPGVHPLQEQIGQGSPTAADLPAVAAVGSGTPVRPSTGLPSTKEEAFSRADARSSGPGSRSSDVPVRPVSQRGTAAPRPNRCWAGSSQPDTSVAETQQTAEDSPQDRVASARSGGRRPLPGGGCGSANLEPMKGQISRPSSAKGQSGEPGTPASTRKSLPAGGPLGHGRQLPAGAAHAAATAMASISGQDEGADVLPLKFFFFGLSRMPSPPLPPDAQQAALQPARARSVSPSAPYVHRFSSQLSAPLVEPVTTSVAWKTSPAVPAVPFTGSPVRPNVVSPPRLLGSVKAGLRPGSPNSVTAPAGCRCQSSPRIATVVSAPQVQGNWRMEPRVAPPPLPVWSRTVGKPVAVPATHRSYVVQTPPVPLKSVLQRSSSAAGQLMTEPMAACGNAVRCGAPRIVARPASCEVSAPTSAASSSRHLSTQAPNESERPAVLDRLKVLLADPGVVAKTLQSCFEAAGGSAQGQVPCHAAVRALCTAHTML